MHLLSKPEDWAMKIWHLRKSLKIGRGLTLELMEAEKLSGETIDNIAEPLASKGFDPDECAVTEKTKANPKLTRPLYALDYISS